RLRMLEFIGRTTSMKRIENLDVGNKPPSPILPRIPVSRSILSAGGTRACTGTPSSAAVALGAQRLQGLLHPIARFSLVQAPNPIIASSIHVVSLTINGTARILWLRRYSSGYCHPAFHSPPS